MTLIYRLYAGEEKSKKISLYIRFVNDRHRPAQFRKIGRIYARIIH
nr:MAG TPA: CadC-like protein [Caudoviricetes sp.]